MSDKSTSIAQALVIPSEQQVRTGQAIEVAAKLGPQAVVSVAVTKYEAICAGEIVAWQARLSECEDARNEFLKAIQKTIDRAVENKLASLIARSKDFYESWDLPFHSEISSSLVADTGEVSVSVLLYAHKSRSYTDNEAKDVSMYREYSLAELGLNSAWEELREHNKNVSDAHNTLRQWKIKESQQGQFARQTEARLAEEVLRQSDQAAFVDILQDLAATTLGSLPSLSAPSKTVTAPLLTDSGKRGKKKA